MVEERLRYAIRFLSRHSKDFSLKEWRQINNPNYTKLLTLPTSIPQPTIPPVTPTPTTVLPPPPPIDTPPPTPPVSSKRFIQVIFRKRGKKHYDYLLGDNKNINVGDFVVVHVNINGKIKWKIAKVIYVSAPGECSLHAKSALIKKADYDKW